MDNVWMRAALQNANKNKRTRERAWMACQSDKQTDTTVFAIVFMLNDREGRSDLSSHRIASHRIASHPSRLIGAEMASAASSSSAVAGGKCVLVTGAAGRTGNEKRRRRRRKMCALIAQRSGVREHS